MGVFWNKTELAQFITFANQNTWPAAMFDIDHTLILPNGRPVPFATAFLQSLADIQVPIIYCTGRPIIFLHETIDQLAQNAFPSPKRNTGCLLAMYRFQNRSIAQYKVAILQTLLDNHIKVAAVYEDNVDTLSLIQNTLPDIGLVRVDVTGGCLKEESRFECISDYRKYAKLSSKEGVY